MRNPGRRISVMLLTLFLTISVPAASSTQDVRSVTRMSVADTTGNLTDSPLAHTVFCLRCSQPYTTLNWDMQHESGMYQNLNAIQFNALGIEFVLYAADEKATFSADFTRMIALLEAMDAEIPEQYRRKHVERIVIIFSSELYCLDYENWTAAQRYELSPDFASYFTSEKAQQNVLGCCTSFPSTRERERVVWMAAGKMLKGKDAQREQVNCAYSYHLYCTEEQALTAMFIHEVTHALTLTVTMPTLDDYGFTPNRNWELQQLALGQDTELYSVEALAYDITTRVMTKYQPQAIFQVMPNVWQEQHSEPVFAMEETGDPLAFFDTPEQIAEAERLKALSENGVFETMEVIEDTPIPLAGEDLATMESMISWILMDTHSDTGGSQAVVEPSQNTNADPAGTIEDYGGMDPSSILNHYSW